MEPAAVVDAVPNPRSSEPSSSAALLPSMSFRSLRSEPQILDAPRRVPRDWVLFGVVVIGALAEGLFRADLTWPAFSVPLTWALAFTILFRRTRPLHAVAFAFGAITIADIIIRIVDGRVFETYSAAFVLVLAYALFRWGSGDQMVVGSGFLFVTYLESIITEWEGVGSAIGGFIVLAIPCLVGVLVRFFTENRRHQIYRAKSEEREQLARELHDTVAHHVSAIAIQAQAGQFLASTGATEGAVDALAVIEEEAARTLTEMRLLVGVLRTEDDAAMAPQPGLADIADLERLTDVEGADGSRPPVISVSLSGDLENVRPSIAAGVHRLAQEAVTNALKHAHHATRVEVAVIGDRDVIRLSVADNGGGRPKADGRPAYGLVGMHERASLLGGTLTAGPRSDRGWTVEAMLPKLGR